MKRWMLVINKRNAKLFHLNEDLLQYKKLKRVDTKLLNKLIKGDKNDRTS